MDKLKIAIIGLGHLGTRHLKTYNELKDRVTLIGLCDTRKDVAERLAHQQQIPFFKNYQNLTGKIDAVNICTPTISHFEIAKYFLERDVNAFIEKPITITLDEADELNAIASKRHLKLQVGHVERFNAAFQAIKIFTKQPLFIECHRLNHFPNRSLDIGVVLDLMIHDIDIILGLVQSPIKDIQAVGTNVLTDLEDIANVRLTFKNGCVCNLTASRVSDEVVRKIRIFLKKTYISLDYVKQEAFIYKKHEKLILKHALPIEKEPPLKKELESFIRCIKEDTTPVISGIEGKEALRVALQINKKIQETQKAFSH